MKPTALTLSTFIIALAGSAAALAQTAPSTPAGAASVLPQGTESTAPTTPLPDAVAQEAPMSRAEVVDETLEARRAGEIPSGEAGITESAPMGEPSESMEAAAILSDTRAETMQETEAAREAGEIPKGEAAVPVKP